MMAALPAGSHFRGACKGRTQAICLALAATLSLTACQSKKDAEQPVAKNDNNASIALLQKVNNSAQNCWMKSKDKAFRSYRVIPELDTRAGIPRILIVNAKAAQGLPQLVIEAQGTPPRLSSYGPLASDALAPRIREDISRWAEGSTACTA